MRQALAILAVAGVMLAGVWWYRPEAGAPAPQAQPTPPTADQSAPAPAAPHKTAPDRAGPPAANAQLPDMTPEEVARERRLLELEQAADRRFSETVELDGLEARDVLPEVRKLFDTLTLEPAFDLSRATDGYVDGMRIADLSSANPLAKAGFHTGDRIVRLDGQPLVDPAQIAYTMMSLGRDFEICAARSGGDYCRTITIGGS